MANKLKVKKELRDRRHKRIRAKIFGTASRPRVSVFRSLKHLYVQLIDDERRVTILSASDSEIKEKGKKVELAEKLGELLAAKAAKNSIAEVVFDKSSYKYHGRIKAVADGARKGGLKF